ncbi:hypothetical protein [Actinomadura gamaensis]|uniref:Transposase n=1 Tax=Actinomadura gamaensis TaxID=1763541 RepID=A0ABV9TZD1_9ACTN
MFAEEARISVHETALEVRAGFGVRRSVEHIAARIAANGLSPVSTCPESTTSLRSTVSPSTPSAALSKNFEIVASPTPSHREGPFVGRPDAEGQAGIDKFVVR